MRSEPLFALTHHWWTWDHPRVREALQAVRLAHVSAVISAALQVNRQNGRSPTTWLELCGEGRIRRDPHHLMKIRRGRHGFNDVVLLGISTALSIDLYRLYPTAEDWIAKAVVVMSKRQFSLSDGQAYVAACLRPVYAGAAAGNGRSAIDDDDAVGRVVAILDPILAEIDGQMDGRRQGA